jgi:NADPH:quinone reductase-like Zn-dependent oxidoreductase
MLVSIFVRQQAKPTVKTQNRDDLIALKELVEAGRIAPVIGGMYPLDRTPQAIEHVAGGHARGTVVIKVSHDPVGPTVAASHMILAGSAA